MVYTPAQVRAALTTFPRVWDFRYERVLKNGVVTFTPELVAECSVTNNDLATEVKRTCTVALSASSTFDYLQHSLRPWARLRMPDGGYYEWPMGTFLLTTPNRTPDSGSLVKVQGYDYLLRLSEMKTSGRLATAAKPGTPTYIGAIQSMLSDAGFTTSNILSNATVLPTDSAAGGATVFEWEPGTSYLRMINDLLSGIGYRSLFMDPYGVPTSYPESATPETLSPLWQYGRDATGLTVDNSTEVALDVWNLPNQWVGSISEPDQAALLYVKTNDYPSSPYSTVSRGRTITYFLTAEEIGKPPDLVTLQGIVDRYAAQTSQQFEQVTFTTGMMPFHGSGDVIDVDSGKGYRRYVETEWEVELKADGTMKHSARRVIDLTAGMADTYSKPNLNTWKPDPQRSGL